MISWSPALPPLLLALAVAVVVAALWWSHRALVRRLGPVRGRAAWAPRVGLGVLLLLALAGPRWRHEELRPPAGSLAVLVDTSSSMDLGDGRGASRLVRARRIAEAVRAAAPSGMSTEILGFDTRLRGALPAELPAGERPGDPAAVLAGLSTDSRLAGCAAAVVVTDGGDEPVALAQPPGFPLWIVGVGPAEGGIPDNLSISDLAAPASAEVDLDVPVAVEVAATGSPAFLARQAAVEVVLEAAAGDGAWSRVGAETVDLRQGRARVGFTRRWGAPGAVQLRASVAPAAGEASPLDNRREAALEVRSRGLHVLFFTREIGAEFKALRQELGRDPGLTFTALLRTVASQRQGDRYALIGERLEGDVSLERGFPTDPAGLARYGVVVVGAFAPESWRPEEAAALRRHVDSGGAVAFLAGQDCAAGGTLAALAPCPPSGGLDRGSFPLAVPAGAAGHPVVDGLGPLFAGSAIETLARCAAPRPGATVLLTAAAGGRAGPVVAVQPFGRGRSAVIASNTLWRLAGNGPAGEAYGRLWRQMVRWLAGSADEGGLVRVRWDKDRYRPGEDAIATILPAASSGVALSATLAAPGAAAAPLALEPAPDAGPGAVRARLRLAERGAWTFKVEALRDGQSADTLERTLAVLPRQGEGSRLAPDHDALARAAEAGGGAYAPEERAADLVKRMAERLRGSPVMIETAPLASPWLLVALLALLVWEWSIRRKAGIV